MYWGYTYSQRCVGLNVNNLIVEVVFQIGSIYGKIVFGVIEEGNCIIQES